VFCVRIILFRTDSVKLLHFFLSKIARIVDELNKRSYDGRACCMGGEHGTAVVSGSDSYSADLALIWNVKTVIDKMSWFL